MSTDVESTHAEAIADRPKSTLAEKVNRMQWGFVLRGILAIIIGVPVLTIIALTPMIAQPVYNFLLFHPMKYPLGRYVNTAVHGIKPNDVYFESTSGSKLHGFIYKVPGAKRIVLISHGNGGNMSLRAHLAFMFLREGTSVFAYDYAGYGRSEGEPSMEGICEDARSAYNYLVSEEHWAPKSIILFGESLGTVVTGYLASTVDSAGVILECPLYSLRRIGGDLFYYPNIYPEWAWTQGGRQLDNSIALPKVHAPLLIIAGTADKLTPINYADELFELASSPKQIIRIKGAGHGDRAMMIAPEYSRGLHHFLHDPT